MAARFACPGRPRTRLLCQRGNEDGDDVVDEDVRHIGAGPTGSGSAPPVTPGSHRSRLRHRTAPLVSTTPPRPGPRRRAAGPVTSRHLLLKRECSRSACIANLRLGHEGDGAFLPAPPCVLFRRILCLAYVERKRMARRTILASRSALCSLPQREVGERLGCSANRFSSSTSCSRWLHEPEPGRPNQSLSCRFLKVAPPGTSYNRIWCLRD